MSTTERLTEFATAAGLDPSIWLDHQHIKVAGTESLPPAQTEGAIKAGLLVVDLSGESDIQQVFVGAPPEVVLTL